MRCPNSTNDEPLPNTQTYRLPLKNGLRDWDCIEALDIPALLRTLDYIHSNGFLPPSLNSKEDQNSIGDSGVPSSLVEELRNKVLLQRPTTTEGGRHLGNPPIAIVDGFLLYGNNMKEVREKLDVRLLLRVGYERAKSRREDRCGYVTLEGFWEDPPGYVDRIVWPNYVQDHSFLFESGDVEGEPDRKVLEGLDIQAQPRMDMDMADNLRWAVDVIMEKPKSPRG